MSNKLASFLIEHGAYDIFIANLGDGISIEGLGGKQDAISRAFIWDGTPQGDNYWRELDYKFRLYFYTDKQSPHKVDTTWDNMWER